MADEWESKHAAINSYECWKLAISELRKRRLEELALQLYQKRAQDFAIQCWGEDAKSPLERGTRAAEEAIELAQAMGVPKATLLRLVEYVYSRPAGPISEEVGDLAFITACIAEMYAWDLLTLAEGRLYSAQSRIDAIQEKHKGKVRAVSWEL